MSKAFECALRLLSRREHGAYELANKLAQKGYADADIQETLHECQRLDLQNDARFVESLMNTRVRQGYGPLRIRRELQQIQIDRELIETALQKEADYWLAHATVVRQKKFKDQQELTYSAMQKQKQFLLYRGFSTDIITMIFNH